MNQRVALLGLAAVAGLVAQALLLASANPARLGAEARVPGAPAVLAVSPATLPNHIDASILLSGTGFEAVLSGSEVLTAPTLYLNAVNLGQAGWLSAGALTATLPWGLVPGAYTVTVVNPDGQSGSLPAALTETQALGVWTTAGPYGGNLTDLAVEAEQTRTVFASVQLVGLLKSVDGGGHWGRTALGEEPDVAHVAFAPAAPATVYASGRMGLVRSTDLGSSWDLAYSGQDVSCFALHPADAAILYVGVWGRGILRSGDGGQTWEERSQGLTQPGIRSIVIDPGAPATLYATADGSAVYKSIDEGRHWTNAAGGLPAYPEQAYVLALNPHQPGDVWAMAPTRSLHRSTDGGQTWAAVPFAYDIPWTMAFSPLVAGSLYAGSAHDVLVSTDGGSSWGAWSQTSIAGMIRQIRLDPATGQPLYLGDNATGFYRSADGGARWEQAVEGMPGVMPNVVVPAPGRGEYVYLMSGAGSYYSGDAAHGWALSAVPETIAAAVDPVNERVAYAATWGPGSIGKTTDGGAGWTQIPVSLLPGRYVAALAIDPTRTERLFAGGGDHWGLFADSHGWAARSDDGGANWQELSIGYAISDVTAIVVDPLVTSTVYLGTCVLQPYWSQGSPSGVQKSTDGGTTWAPSNAGLEDRCVRDLALSPLDARTLYAAINGPVDAAAGLYTSTDGGASWQPHAAGLDTRQVLEIAIDPLLPLRMYAATWHGLFSSTDAGETWAHAGGALGQLPVFSVASAPARGGGRTFVYVGTIGGVLRPPGAAGGRALPATTVPAGVYNLTVLHPPLAWRVDLPLARR